MSYFSLYLYLQNPSKEKKNESLDDRKRSYEHHDHCHKAQAKPTHTVPPKLSKYDELGAMLAAEEMEHKKERHQHHPMHGLAHL